MAESTILDRVAPDGVRTDGLRPALAAEVDHLAGRDEHWQALRPDVHPAVRARALLGEDPVAARRALEACAGGPWDRQGVVAATWAASRLGAPADLVDELDSLIAAEPGPFLVDDAVPLGPVPMLHGLLRVVDGRLDDADAALREAVEIGDRRAPVWGAIARVEWYRVAETRRLIGDSDRVPRSALTAAQTFFAAGGYRHLASRAADDATAVRAGVLAQGSRWLVGFGAQPPVEVRDAKGLRALRHLVVHRGRPVAAVELDRVADGMDDAAARLDLPADIGEDEAELAAVLRDDAVRSRVSKLVRRTLTRLAGAHRTLGAHLAASVRTGYVCVYRGDEQCRWRL